MNPLIRFISRLVCAGWVLCVGQVASQSPPSPPGQPAKGPGGSDYRHREVTSSFHGDKARSWWRFEPSNPPPDKPLPVVVFLHGWSAIDPQIYGAWIKHLVRHGRIVIYPAYQDSLFTSPRDFAPNAIDAVKQALSIQNPGRAAEPDASRLAVFGHSAGGFTGANLCARAAAAGLPQPQALFVLQPGKTNTRDQRDLVGLDDLAALPSSTLLLALAGDRDRLVGDADAERVFRESTSIPAQNKDFVMLRSDEHGSPGLHADHLAPCCFDASIVSDEVRRQSAELLAGFRINRHDPGTNSFWAGLGARFLPTNTLDWLGCWRLGDALLGAAFEGRWHEMALGGGSSIQSSLGHWSDGTPVTPLSVKAAP